MDPSEELIDFLQQRREKSPCFHKTEHPPPMGRCFSCGTIVILSRKL
jgi:hypothetical protein